MSKRKPSTEPKPKAERFPSPEMVRLAANILDLKRRARMSERTIAEAVGLSQPMAHRWIDLTSTPDAIQASVLAGLFNVPLDILVNEDVPAMSNRELGQIRSIADIIRRIGYEETHRRLLIAEPRVGRAGTNIADDDDEPRKGRGKKAK